MSSKEIIYNEDARQQMRAGIDKVANAVKVTLGPRGRNVVLNRPWGGPKITKDGVTVAKEITLKNDFEDVGAQLCKQVALTTNNVVGDGTSTATVLVQSMVAQGMKYIATGANSSAVKRGMEKAAKVVVEYINNQKKEITYSDKNELLGVATMSGNDSEIGEMVANAFVEAGANGIVTFEESKGIKSTMKTTEGFHFDRGFLAPHFVTDGDKMRVEYEDCLILLWDQRITDPNSIIPLLDIVAGTKRPLLIIADDVDTDALAVLVYNKLKGVIKVVAVRSPGFGERKADLMADMALLTDTVFFDDSIGRPLEKVLASELGVANKVVVTKDSTTIIGGKGKKEDIEAKIVSLKNQIKASESVYDKEKLTERIAKLSGSVAIIQIGATIETEFQEKKDRYEDAICATKAAIEQGIVAGGGITLYKARKALSKLKATSADEAFGISIVADALETPINTILENAGFSTELRNKIFVSISRGGGYDGRTGEVISDMFKTGIVDPAKVVCSTIESAATIAGLFLTSEAVIIDSPEDKPTPNPYLGGAY